jgi:hypothetical protein
MSLEYSYFIQSLNTKQGGVPVFPLWSPGRALELFDVLQNTKFEVILFRVKKETIRSEAERVFYRKLHHILDRVLRIPYFVIFDAGADEVSAKQAIRDGFMVVNWEVLFMEDEGQVFDKINEMAGYAREHHTALIASIGKFKDGKLICPLSNTHSLRNVLLSAGLAGFEVEILENVQKDFVAKGVKQIDFELINRMFVESKCAVSLMGGRYLGTSIEREMTKYSTILSEDSLKVSEHGVKKALEKGLKILDLTKDFEVYDKIIKEGDFSYEKRMNLLKEMMAEYEKLFGYTN